MTNMADIIEKILLGLGGGALVTLAIFLLRWYGGERQNLYGKTTVDLIGALKTALETNQELQKSVDDADDRLRGVLMRSQHEKEEEIARIVKQMQNGEARAEATEKMLEGEIRTFLIEQGQHLTKIKQLSDNLSGVVQEAKKQAEIHHKEMERKSRMIDKVTACMIENQSRIVQLGGTPIELQ